ncbi:MAG: hypothetical protein WKG01_23440 [Kofleriaceae bacterium]
MELPPAGLSWGEYVDRWVDDCGGWLPLADQLIYRAQEFVEIGLDPQTVERGLRRLARRGHKPGGQYGRWMLRFFGFTSPIEQWVKWLGTYHSRFADLPCSLRIELLALWNRPPISESPLVSWIEHGIAIAHHSRLDMESCWGWLARAEKHAAAAGPAAEIEVALFSAQLEVERLLHTPFGSVAPPGKAGPGDADGRGAMRCRYQLIEDRLRTAEIPAADEVAYRARLADLRSRDFSRPAAGDPLDLVRARAHYEAIPESAVPFASFRKYSGLAYCAWRLGNDEEARRLAQRAVDDAGDGGLVRMRIQALNMLSRIVPAVEAEAVNARARSMAAALEDENLLRRVNLCAPLRAAR